MANNPTPFPDLPNIKVLESGKSSLFCNYVFKAIPLAFDESLSYYECLCGLLSYLKNTIIPTVNNNAEAVVELQNLYGELHDYVENYFDNLDVQEEINNKLDAMVEDGTLSNIINSYLFSELQPVKIIIPKNVTGDIQSGEICLIKTKEGKTILYDTHRAGALSFVMDFLDRNEISHLDYVILSHYHDDHVGNFVSLVNNHYIDSDTQIFLPAYSNLIEQSETTLAYYNAVQNCILNNNLTARIPTPEEIITIDDVDVQFFNCSTALFESMGVTNYNDCSTIVLLSYGNQKTLLTGDAVDKPYTYFINNKKLNFKINNYQIEHHGYSMTNSVTPFMKQINPDNAFVFNTQYSLINNNSCVRSTSLSYMSMKESNIIIQGYNENDTIIYMFKNYTSIDGKTRATSSTYAFANTFYVDSSVNTGDFQNGSQLYPFKNIQQALSCINKSDYAHNVINLADGEYNFPYHIITSSVNLTINGNSEDNTAVKIINRMSFYDCVHIEFNNISFENETSIPLVFNDCNVLMNNCIIDGNSSSNGINVDNSKCYFNNISVNGCSNGIYATNSIMNINTGSFTENNRGYRYNNVIFNHLSLTYTDNVTSEYLVENSSNVTDSVKEVTLIGPINQVLEADDVLTLSYDITKCKSITLCFGRNTDGTWNCNTIYPHDNTFKLNDSFRAKTMSATIYFEITGAKELTVHNVYTNTQALRKIIGYLQ